MSGKRYVQRLEAIELSIEKGTDRSPDSRGYHVFKGQELVESCTNLRDAQARFRAIRDQSGWKPPEVPQVSPEEQLRRERDAMDRNRQVEHWASVSNARTGFFKGHRI